MHFERMTLKIINKRYIFDPKKYAFNQTTIDPIHIMTKIDVMIVCWDYEVLKAKVVESKRHKTNGPQRSPI